MIRVGITGGIGSGKSYISRWLEREGIPVYGAGREAKRLMLSDESIRCGLVALLGEKVYEGGVLNKPLLATYIFSGAAYAARINAIVHPRVKADFVRWAKEMGGMVAFESAILYEAGFADVVDAVVAVHAPEMLRIRRVMERDGCTEEQVRARMAVQADDGEKCRRADFVVENDGVQPFLPQWEMIVAQLKSGNFVR